MTQLDLPDHLLLSRIEKSDFILADLREAAHRLGGGEMLTENELNKTFAKQADLRSDTTAQTNEMWKTGKFIAKLS